MARRRKRTTRRKRSVKPMLKVIPTVAAVASASALTNATMGLGILPFLTEGWLTARSASSPSDVVSLSELFKDGFGMSASFQAQGTTIGDLISRNFKKHGNQALMMLIGAKVVPKLLTKTGVPRTFNKLLKDSGLGSIVQL